MQTIAYYISDYGYGHASRSVALIRELLERKPFIRMIVCTSFPLAFVKQSLASYPNVQYRDIVNDIGYVLANNSLEPDIARFNSEYDQYINNIEDRIDRETNFLLAEKVDCVLSDIAPVPFVSADVVGIPSIGISNFTWYTAYTNWIPEEKLRFLKEAYGKVDHFIALAGANEPRWGRVANHTAGFISRRVDPAEVSRIRDMAMKHSSKMLVYIGFGMKVHVDVLSSWPIWNSANASFIVSSSHAFEHPNVMVIPRDDVESQHYIAASDLVITKAGWGTVSEAVSAGKPLLILHRNGMQEDANTIRYLHKRNLCNLISWDELPNLSLEPEILQEQSWSAKQYLASNQEHREQLIDLIVGILDENMGRRKE